MADGQPDPVRFPTLIMTGGPLDGTEYPLPLTGKPIVLGSSVDADVQILLGNIEAAHAFIAFGSGELVLSDAGSATGTFVNGEMVENERALHDGDRICLGPPGAKGSAKLLLRLPSGSRAGAAPAMGTQDHAPALAEQGAAPTFGGAEPATAAGRPSLDGETGLELSSIVESAIDSWDAPGEAAPRPEEPLLFSSPLPPTPPADPGRAAAAAKAAPVPSPPPVPSPAAPPAAPPPPPAPPARAATPRPDYHAELPSIPVAGQSQLEGLGRDAEFPTLRPSGRRTTSTLSGPKGRSSARRRGLFGLSSLPVLPIVGALAAVAMLGGAAWLLLPRSAPPQLVSVLPLRAEPGQMVTLTGKNFAKDAGANTVLFGALRAAVSSATASELKVVVPRDAKSTVQVVVETHGGRTSPLTVTVMARGEATGVEPDVALPGQTILVRGQDLSGKVSVLVAGMPATSVESTPEGVRAVVPDVGLPEGVKTNVTVQTGSGPARTFDLLLGRLPLVLSVKPEAGPVGQLVTIQGRGFDPGGHGNSVTFAGQPALLVASTATELRAVVPAPPAGDMQGELAVVVTAAGRASSSRATFQVSRGATAGFRPRFFPSPVTEYPGDDLAFVSTEIGPVLLLAGRAGGPTSAERALTTAAALNAVVDAAPGRPAAFELREKPEPAVALAGDPRPLLAPTPEDAAAYSRPWETGRGPGRRVSASTLARHWTALLQDYLGLFLERQRPIQFVALSPRGRVLSDIYAEANRRSPGERTVPTSIVLPAPASMATALRQMALVVSVDAPRAAIAVEGRWQGRIEDPDRGAQAFQAQLRSDSGRLAGTISTWAGSIEVQTPLRDVGFEHGSVRFTADLQGTPHRFKGTLDRNTVSGTVERSGKPALPFTMQFVE